MSSKRSRAAFEADGPPQHAPYATYGTPLPAYDPEARDDGSYVPVWKQEVTDEHGRKRLHGAFTGGFSAGYFNSVGSKEGWTPSTFVSSRSNRAKDADKRPQQRAEDFMDDEDLAEQAESQKLETQDAFAGLGSGSGDGAAKGMFADLFKTTGETMGVKLLQRMGWRQGQGVGPKVRRRAQGDERGEAHLFAPENTRMIGFARKTNRKGLGFAGESSLDGSRGGNSAQTAGDEDEDEDTDARILSRSKVLAKTKKPNKSSFGVGVLNDTGSDDEDPYAIGPAIKYNRIIGGDKKKRKGGLISSTTTTTPRPTFTSQKLAQRSFTTAGFRICHDGRLPLDGFVLTSKPLLLLQDNQYPPPVIPEGWRSSKRATKFSDTAPSYQSTAEAAKSSSLDPKARAALLGEQQLPGKSVFDFLSSTARDKLASASGKANLPQGRGEGAPEGFESSTTADRRTLYDLVPPLDKFLARDALHRGANGWMPYAEDEAKRERYRAFLRLRSGEDNTLPPKLPTFTTQDWANEMNEFAQAARVFKPISGLMASRFMSSTASSAKLASDAPDPTPATAKKPADPAEEAAKAGMYGTLTRSRTIFYPTRLLCKRFNVRPPANVAPDASGSGGWEDEKSDLVSKASLNQMMMHANFNMPSFDKGGVEGGGERKEDEGGTWKEPARVDAEVNEALEGMRADDDLFKSVFAD